MSSEDVRDAIKAAVVEASAPTSVFDLSDYVSLEDCLSEVDSEAVLIQYVAADEEVASIGGYGNQGWEQTGSVVLHYMVPVGFESKPNVQKGDSIREYLRGKRLTRKIVIESCTPFSDGGGGMYGGSWKGWLSNLFYVRRDCG